MSAAGAAKAHQDTIADRILTFATAKERAAYVTGLADCTQGFAIVMGEGPGADRMRTALAALRTMQEAAEAAAALEAKIGAITNAVAEGR